MNNRLRVAVIGVGHLGQHHARLLAALDGADLVGVVDTKPGRADEVAAKYGTKAWPSASDLNGHVDAVTIAVPTVSHLEVALPFLERGVAALVEKPLAPTVADAERQVDGLQLLVDEEPRATPRHDRWERREQGVDRGRRRRRGFLRRASRLLSTRRAARLAATASCLGRNLLRSRPGDSSAVGRQSIQDDSLNGPKKRP